MTHAPGDWYLKEWLAEAGKIQASLVNELGWDKARANFMYHGKQSYKRDDVRLVSEWLGIEPYELLMAPDKAMAIRRLVATAEAIVADNSPDRFLPKPAPIARSRRTGTDG